MNLLKPSLYIIAFLFFSSFSLTTQTTVLNHTGAVQNYVIPANSTQLTINTRGAQGGNFSDGVRSSTGGLGAIVTSTFPVGGANPLQPGQIIFVYVGEVGQNNGLLGGTSAGGFNGGGDAPIGNDINGGGGGGASDIRAGGMALTDRIIIAGGGGGAGTGNSLNGGVGGNMTGGDGSPSNIPDEGDPGLGGTQIAGGMGGLGNPTPSRDGTNGVLGIGGNGGFTGSGGGGAGGGGGFYAGGGGGASNGEAGGAGGGGSSFSSGNNTTIVAGCPTCIGNGQVTIISSAVAVPTLSEWGLIILALLIISIGVVYATQKEIAVASSSINFQAGFHFDKKFFLKFSGMALVTILVIGMIAVINFGYEIMPFDFVGSIISAGLIGFILQKIMPPKQK